jgi:hypothetical protein
VVYDWVLLGRFWDDRIVYLSTWCMGIIDLIWPHALFQNANAKIPNITTKIVVDCCTSLPKTTETWCAKPTEPFCFRSAITENLFQWPQMVQGLVAYLFPETSLPRWCEWSQVPRTWMHKRHIIAFDMFLSSNYVLFPPYSLFSLQAKFGGVSKFRNASRGTTYKVQPPNCWFHCLGRHW